MRKDANRVFGGISKNNLLGNKGNDSFSGGQGSDRFVLAPDNGSNIIQDFEDGIDFLQLNGGIAFENLTLTEESGNTVINSGSQRLALVSGVASSLLTPEDFLIAESES
ncbi:MAG: hypothetical protein O4804_21810 [Trichodesmium sp. St11_bin5]|nr:hypothetical protein [Trichodesmium sp. St11_bin5]